ncbi:LysE family translocator [Sphingobium sp. PNB]|uniref:LysE family translocator n=1 Tax=Sphingobium sp. PNB TaxID=863934 RepID=UPI001CA3E439|nr:LysE family translocator [Sphingobium sp. PNB]MCB4858457.1 LysE family translocator [Sphingobium sp. PNB]
MAVENLVAFLVTATVLTMVPGLDTAMVLRSATLHGARYGIATAIGIAVGCLCWGSAAAFGLAALLRAWPSIFAGLKWAGAIYLAWLGLQFLFRPRCALATETEPRPAGGLGITLRGGLVTNLLNPKVGLFYMTLLPQFIPASARGSGPALMLASLHVGIVLIWFWLLSTLSEKIRPWLRRPGVMRTVDRVTGGIFVILGLELVQVAGLHA